MERRKLVWRVLATLLMLVAVNALLAGPLLVLGPDGRFLGLPQEDLDGSPFADYAVPGLALAGLGVLHAAAFVLQVRRSPRAWFWSGFAAAGLCVWIVVQLFVIEPFFLQPTLFAMGAAEGLLSLAQWRIGQWDPKAVADLPAREAS